MKTIIVATLLAVSGVPAFAQAYHGRVQAPRVYDDELATGSIRLVPGYRAGPQAPEHLSGNPAAEGNAQMQTRPVQNYGNVSGGYENAE